MYSSVSVAHCVPGTNILTIHKIFITGRPNEVMEIKFRIRISGSITAHHECRAISTICCLLFESDKVLGPEMMDLKQIKKQLIPYFSSHWRSHFAWLYVTIRKKLQSQILNNSFLFLLQMIPSN